MPSMLFQHQVGHNQPCLTSKRCSLQRGRLHPRRAVIPWQHPQRGQPCQRGEEGRTPGQQGAPRPEAAQGTGPEVRSRAGREGPPEEGRTALVRQL